MTINDKIRMRSVLSPLQVVNVCNTGRSRIRIRVDVLGQDTFIPYPRGFVGNGSVYNEPHNMHALKRGSQQTQQP